MVESSRVGAVDLGSNSFHLVVAQESQGRIQVLDRIKERVGLGAGVGRAGQLDEEVARRALRCLELFRQRLESVPPRRIRAVGTKAFRDLRRHPDFHRRAERALGARIEVVAGEEEARLIYLGVHEAQRGAGGRILVVDIGGGSTEVVAGSEPEPALTESLSMGSSSYSQRFFPGGRLRKRDFTKAVLRARNQVKPVAAALRRHGWDRAFGSSGTMLALAKMLDENGWGDGGITRDGLLRLCDRLTEFADMDAVEVDGLKESRRAVLPGGLAIALGVVEELDIARLEVSDAALREGLLVDLLGRLHDRDVRGDSVRHLAERFHVDVAQADRVTATAREVFEAVREPWGLSRKRDLPFLVWACVLHEVGLVISHTGFHRHGAYLIEHSDPPGFSREETRLLGTLVRLQRRRIPADAAAGLPEALGGTLLRLLMPLRVAIRLHRARADEALPALTYTATEDTLWIHGPKGWGEQFPMTEDNLLAEVRRWRDHPLHLELRNGDGD